LLDLKRSCSNRAVAQASLYSDCLNRLGPRAGEQNTVTTWIDGRTRRRSTSIKCVVNRRSGGAAENVHGNFLRKRSTIRKDKGLRNSRGRSWRGCRSGGRRWSWRGGRGRGGCGCRRRRRSRSRSRGRIECLVGVAVKYPGGVDPGIQPHVNGAPVGGNIVYGNRTDGQYGRSVDVSAARRTSHKKNISISTSRTPLESDA